MARGRLTIHAWDGLKASNGAVVFISGNAAVIPKPAAAAVGAINAAIEALAKAFAERGIEDGVQVNSVSPGAIMTGRRLAMLEKVAAAKNIGLEDAKRQFLEQARIGRFGEVEEIAEAIAFVPLASRPLDDRHGAPHRRRRGQIRLTARTQIGRQTSPIGRPAAAIGEWSCLNPNNST